MNDTEARQAASLGAAWDGRGVDFSVESAHATAVDLCLFDDGEVESRVPMTRDGATWRARVEGTAPGQRYGLRADGPWDPARGHLFDPARLLVDPRAPRVEDSLTWHASLRSDAPRGVDTAPFMPKGVVLDPSFDWGDDARPATQWRDTVIYEAHVKGLTARHPEVPRALRGTYLGLACAPVVEHLRALSVTAVELMPVAHHVPERRLLEQGRTNYWGYSPLAFLAPHASHASVPGEEARELKAAVRALHAAGIEVIVDACLGHTVESDARGMTLSLRGLDNASYYRMGDGGAPIDWTGCGNTLDASHPITLRLVLDALRKWAVDYRVDGFRLDQAVVLGRGADGAFSREAPFFRAIADDPALRDLKWIAEPWDLGPDGYRLGGFPEPFVEWNDRFRIAARAAWRGDAVLPELATRLAGSSDVFAGRHPLASVSYVACHDGFTLHDVSTYERKRNEANGEGNRDGTVDDRSCGWGVDGETTRPSTLRRRRRATRNLLATLALSQGVPLLGHGDEAGRTQDGNNNAYCHDSASIWLDWSLDASRRDLLDFARRALALRRRSALLRRGAFLSEADVEWLRPDGKSMTLGDWHARPHALGKHLKDGDDALLVLLNTGRTRERFVLPASPRGWREALCSARRERDIPVVGVARVPPFSVVVLEPR